MTDKIKITATGELGLDEAEAYAKDILARIEEQRANKEPDFRPGEIWSARDDTYGVHFFVVHLMKDERGLRLWRMDVWDGEPDSSHATHEYWSAGKFHKWAYRDWRPEFNADGSRVYP
jgi:hypothetical protein